MASFSAISILLSFFLMSHLSFKSAKAEPSPHLTCVDWGCKEKGATRFIADFKGRPCGVYETNCLGGVPKIQFEEGGGLYVLKNVSEEEKMLVIQDDLKNPLHLCDSLQDFAEPHFQPTSFEVVSPMATFFKCKPEDIMLQGCWQHSFNYTRCGGPVLLYFPNKPPPPPPRCTQNCTAIEIPMKVLPEPSSPHWLNENLESLLGEGFAVRWELPPECFACRKSNRIDNVTNTTSSHGRSSNDHARRRSNKIVMGVCAGVGSCIIACLLVLLYLYYRKRRVGAAPAPLSRGMSSDPSSRSELGKEGIILPTHIFTHEELEYATNNFDPSKELGDGGFGTVYHGKLKDGRSVAVKRLYENNHRRVEQFVNEIEILSCLRHQNLVTLYGCTSRHSRELLLVYEYIPNGTVADHLHGDRAKDGCLAWPIRMNIAIESADVLSYLHAVDIIHRDVKTNNILLDNNFRVKVADFGLSRLFPMNKTHVSTAPQGTPGYLDPDYHRCYQLNDKSDVYSFGVVLIELISSMPAVDITRHRHEINLANMAINKIHTRALHEMVDPTLGYESDHAVRRMITLVAELAFRCLQDEKEVRPNMHEVLKVLQGIENEDYKVEKGAEVDVLAEDDAVLLNKKMPPASPDSVTNAWTGHSTTPNASA